MRSKQTARTSRYAETIVVQTWDQLLDILRFPRIDIQRQIANLLNRNIKPNLDQLLLLFRILRRSSRYRDDILEPFFEQLLTSDMYMQLDSSNILLFPPNALHYIISDLIKNLSSSTSSIEDEARTYLNSDISRFIQDVLFPQRVKDFFNKYPDLQDLYAAIEQLHKETLIYPPLSASLPVEPLPPGWKQRTDFASGKTYYLNTVTNTMQWDPPANPPPPLPQPTISSDNSGPNTSANHSEAVNDNEAGNTSASGAADAASGADAAAAALLVLAAADGASNDNEAGNTSANNSEVNTSGLTEKQRGKRKAGWRAECKLRELKADTLI